MKRSICFFILFLYLFSYQSTIYAAGSSTAGNNSVYDTIQKGEDKQASSPKNVVDSRSPSLFPIFIKFIFSFLLVVALLIVFMRFLSKRNQVLQSNGPVLPLGGHTLGNNRSLQVVLIGQTIYIIGVGDSITLIRSISQGEEYQHLLEGYENQAEVSPKWLPKDPKKLWDTVFQRHIKKIKQENGEE